jgi:hypothetical protein
MSRLIPAISEATNAVHDANRIRKATPGPVSEYQLTAPDSIVRPQATTGRLRAGLAEYQEHYNAAGPHQGVDQRTPDGNPDAFHGTTADLDSGRTCRKPVLNGLTNECRQPLPELTAS